MTKIFHSIEFQEQALIKGRQRGTGSVQDVANDLNMNVGMLRKWTSKSNRKVVAGKPGARLPDNLPAQSGALPREFKPCSRHTPCQRCSYMLGVGKRGCLNTSSRPGVTHFAVPLQTTHVKPKRRCVNCNLSMKCYNAICAEKGSHWRKRQPCWCYKKSSGRCRGTRASERNSAAQRPAGAYSAGLHRRCTPKSGLHPNWPVRANRAGLAAS